MTKTAGMSNEQLFFAIGGLGLVSFLIYQNNLPEAAIPFSEPPPESPADDPLKKPSSKQIEIEVAVALTEEINRVTREEYALYVAKKERIGQDIWRIHELPLNQHSARSVNDLKEQCAALRETYMTFVRQRVLATGQPPQVFAEFNIIQNLTQDYETFLAMLVADTKAINWEQAQTGDVYTLIQNKMEVDNRRTAYMQQQFHVDVGDIEMTQVDIQQRTLHADFGGAPGSRPDIDGRRLPLTEDGQGRGDGSAFNSVGRNSALDYQAVPPPQSSEDRSVVVHRKVGGPPSESTTLPPVAFNSVQDPVRLPPVPQGEPSPAEPLALRNPKRKRPEDETEDFEADNKAALTILKQMPENDPKRVKINMDSAPPPRPKSQTTVIPGSFPERDKHYSDQLDTQFKLFVDAVGRKQENEAGRRFYLLAIVDPDGTAYDQGRHGTYWSKSKNAESIIAMTAEGRPAFYTILTQRGKFEQLAAAAAAELQWDVEVVLDVKQSPEYEYYRGLIMSAQKLFRDMGWTLQVQSFYK